MVEKFHKFFDLRIAERILSSDKHTLNDVALTTLRNVLSRKRTKGREEGGDCEDPPRLERHSNANHAKLINPCAI